MGFDNHVAPCVQGAGDGAGSGGGVGWEWVGWAGSMWGGRGVGGVSWEWVGAGWISHI